MKKGTILVTGGAGYIGSHTCVALSAGGYETIILDNFSNSKESSIARIKEISGVMPKFIKADVRDDDALDSVFKNNKIDAVIHFAGLKAVGESTEKPLEYYENNVYGAICLMKSMKKNGVKSLVFSSSATVYGTPPSVPIREDFPLQTASPYGRTKLMIEEILRDFHLSDPSWSIAILRYFNPTGAHSSGLIGEDPNGIPNNLTPYITQVAIGRLKELQVFGNDYPTKDGTGVRDYIHVVDLAEGHVKALEKLSKGSGLFTYNLGTGNGYSVLDMVAAFEKATGKKIPYRIAARRSGDIAECFADPTLAATELNWKTKYGLEEMARDSWKWQSTNPNGYV
ncbi:UDP-glucose 4-epimerase GalE [Desulforegula conservatrix]|uniref:UDP-glucose 4-epimerase GalE n=1 Tax=Desulforegula conservatrix TaxID=153026 RepID=UPI000427EE6A|nr:UDP-glucose 4-epimerase GalE [Desulforegula conservatrix]